MAKVTLECFSGDSWYDWSSYVNPSIARCCYLVEISLFHEDKNDGNAKGDEMTTWTFIMAILKSEGPGHEERNAMKEKEKCCLVVQQGLLDIKNR